MSKNIDYTQNSTQSRNVIEKEFDRLMNEFQDKLEAAFKDKEKDILTI